MMAPATAAGNLEPRGFLIDRVKLTEGKRHCCLLSRASPQRDIEHRSGDRSSPLQAMSVRESQQARSPPSAMSGGLSQINTCDHACKHSAESFATHRASRSGLPGMRSYGRDLVSSLKAASRGQGRFPVLATCPVENRLEPALAGQAWSFIAHFHALQEPTR